MPFLYLFVLKKISIASMTKQNYKYFPILQHYYIKKNIWQNKKACR